MPIVFAFVVGRCIKTVAHWRLQQGDRIGRLDLLYGSTTVIGTVSTMFDIGEFSIVTLFLIIVWILSPLGAQSGLRVLSFRSGVDTSFKSVSYLNSSATFPDYMMLGDIGSSCLPTISLFLSSLGAPNATKQSSLDTWGNVKVPIIELLPGYNGTDSKEWIPLEKTDIRSNLTYSSLIGIPVGAISQDQNSSFTIETSYLNLDCNDLELIPTMNFSDKVDEIKELSPDLCEGGEGGEWPCAWKMTWGELATIPYPKGHSNSTPPLRCSNPNPNWTRKINYLSWDNHNGTFTTCSINTTYVELRVECVGWDCISTAIRPSALSNPGPNHTIFDGLCDSKSRYTFSWFMIVLNTLTAVQTGTGSQSVSLLQAYLIDPESALNTSALYLQPAVNTLKTSIFSLRLSQIFNTYWLAIIGNDAVFLGHPDNYDSLRDTYMGRPISSLDSNVTITKLVEKVHCAFGWIIPLVLSTTIMLAASILTMAVDVELRVPKMLMNMTTLTRGDPKAFGLPPGGGSLPDEMRGKLIRDLRVRFGPMDGHEADDYRQGICAENGGTVYTTEQRRVVVAAEESRPSSRDVSTTR